MVPTTKAIRAARLTTGLLVASGQNLNSGFCGTSGFEVLVGMGILIQFESQSMNAIAVEALFYYVCVHSIVSLIWLFLKESSNEDES